MHPTLPNSQLPAHVCRVRRRSIPRTVAVSLHPSERLATVQQVHDLWADRAKSGIRLIDVRSVREFKNETILGAANASLYDIPTNWPLGAIDVVLRTRDDLQPPFSKDFETGIRAALGARGKAQEAVLFCSDEQRSKLAVELLSEEGYDSLLFMAGGLSRWLEAFSPRGVPRKRVVQGVYKDTAEHSIWTDSAEEDTVLPASPGKPADYEFPTKNYSK